MEILKKNRTIARSLFTKAKKALEDKLESSPVDVLEVKTAYDYFSVKADKLFKLDDSVTELLLASDLSAESIEAEEASTETYRYDWLRLKNKVESNPLLNPAHAESKYDSASLTSNTIKRKFRLPQLELIKFDGSAKNWLPFWGMFRKIHDDDNIDTDEKFQYLIQSMEVGSSARMLVESFPSSGNHYKEALEQLKARYARDELLIEIYVRELLALILEQSKGNTVNLTTLYDRLRTQLRALESLGVTSDKYACMLYPLVESALPADILRIWERTRKESQDQNQPLSHLLTFLKTEVESEELIEISRKGLFIKEERVPTAACLVDGETKQKTHTCIWCDQTSHTSLECYKPQRMSLKARIDIIKDKKACMLCLKPGHNIRRCKNRTKCFICTKRHAPLLCSETDKLQQKEQDENDIKPSTSKSRPLTNSNFESALTQSHDRTTILQTLVVNINGELVRAFIDTGAQRSYIRTDLAQKLKLAKIGTETLAHNLFGGVQTNKQKHVVYNFVVKSLSGEFALLMTALDKVKICGYIPRIRSTASILAKLESQNVILSDTGDENIEIGLLIGADFSGLIMTDQNLIPLENGVVALKTKLGWTVQGPLTSNHTISSSSVITHAMLEVGHLWDLETIGISDPVEARSRELLESEVMRDFRQKITLNEHGRYEVALPWKEGHLELNDNKILARKRLMSTTKRLEALKELNNYREVFMEWLELGIIERETDDTSPGHYLPHHAVIKNSSLTTRVRPVFDASAKGFNGISLNDTLEKGQNFLDLLPILITRFRMHAIGISADIKKAFLQIAVRKEDRAYLRFLWWEGEDKNRIITYKHCRVVFGLTCSPFLLAATIIYHLDRCPAQYQKTAQLLKDSFYVDNCILSLESESEAEQFIREAKLLMSEGQFDLRAWITTPMKSLKMNEEVTTTSILGMNWDTLTDQLYCNINALKELSDKTTKRELLSVTQRVFDPIGVSCPTTLIPKLLIQRAWKENQSWDTPVSDDLQKEFSIWVKQVHLLSECRIPRRLSPHALSVCRKSIHVFSDASSCAYATCMFLRTVDPENEIHVQLIQAKSRVTPLKSISIPRLELMAALISTRLYVQMRKALQLSDCQVYFWTDSTVTLTWITTSGDWNVFVRNRVNEIRSETNPEQWHYVPGYLNPADLPSRGCSAKALVNSKWWEGPFWLRKDEQSWPTMNSLPADQDEIDRERKKNKLVSVNLAVELFSNSLLYFSKYSKIVRTVAWILRIAYNAKASTMSKKGSFTADEITNAETTLFLLIQSETISKKELKLEVCKRGHDDLLRVKTRLTLSSEEENFKYPVLLPGSHVIVERLVEQRHRNLNHAGMNILCSHLRDDLWVLGVRKVTRKVIQRCIICKRFKAKGLKTPCAPLPNNRVKDAAPFEVTGMDAAGPFILKTGEKCWMIIYTCAIYRAIHLELVNSLSTECFLMSLRRFIARRGRCQVIYTDNGSNFVGANNLLKSIDWTEVQGYSVTPIKWYFNPPGAPWWGGWWERLIGLVKDLLRRNLGNATLTYVELETILCDCEALINSRPLTYISEGDCLQPLTPASFLRSPNSTEVPEIDFIDAESLNLRLKYLQKLRSDLRQRFTKEYLGLMVNKGKHGDGRLNKGDVVLLQTDGKRITWPLGLVLEVYEGPDGNSRVAKVKTASGDKIRAVQKLFPLEVSVRVEEPLQPILVEKATRTGRVVRLPSRYKV